MSAHSSPGMAVLVDSGLRWYLQAFSSAHLPFFLLFGEYDPILTLDSSQVELGCGWISTFTSCVPLAKLPNFSELMKQRLYFCLSGKFGDWMRRCE